MLEFPSSPLPPYHHRNSEKLDHCKRILAKSYKKHGENSSKLFKVHFSVQGIQKKQSLEEDTSPVGYYIDEFFVFVFFWENFFDVSV